MKKILITSFLFAWLNCAFAQEFSIDFIVSDGIHNYNLTIGIDEDGGTNYNPDLDVFAPPPPPSGAFDARIVVSGEDYFTKFLDNSAGVKTFRFNYVPATGQGPITFSWDNSVLSGYGSFRVRDTFGGGIVNVDLADFGGSFQPAVFNAVLQNGFILEVTPTVDTSVDDSDYGKPKSVQLHQNYPNPFNPTTQIQYTLPETAEVRLEVFNMAGQRVATLVNGQMQAGVHTASFNAANLDSGVYIYRLSAGNFVQTRKMVLIK